MDPSIARRLVELNHAFYQRFATEFAATRSTFQPGMLRALDVLSPFKSLLDVACGDGRVADALREGRAGNEPSCYVGLDFSAQLLSQRGPWPPAYELHEVDLTGAWGQHPAVASQRSAGGFDAAVCFSALFHLPTQRARLRLLQELRRCLRPGGRAAISVWQFLHVPHLSRRVVPWEELGLTPSDVEEGDLLMDWWRGGRGVRYVHHFRPGELEQLCARVDLAVQTVFESDGRTGDMGHFVIAQAGGVNSPGL